LDFEDNKEIRTNRRQTAYTDPEVCRREGGGAAGSGEIDKAKTWANTLEAEYEVIAHPAVE
jgi:hypothetical protein